MNRAHWKERGRAVAHRLARLPRRTAIALLVILVVLVAARVAAPIAIEWVLNRKLASLEDYRGHIDDVDLSILDSELAVDGLRLDRRKGDPELPFLRVERMEVDYRWDALFRGEIVADVVIRQPLVNIMPQATQKKDPSKQLEKEEEGQAITETVQTLLPTKIHHLHITGGKVRFKDPSASPDVDLRLTRLDLFVSNLSNRPAPASEMPTRGRATATIQGSGRLRAQFRLNVYAKQPTFDLDLGLRGLDVRELKDLTRAHAKVDLEKGRASFYTELVAKKGEIHGYFKPMLDDVEVLDSDGGDKDDAWYRKAWEGTVGAVEEVFEDQDKDRAATRVPISGQVDQPGIGVWVTVVELVTNAFIEALFPGVDHSIGGDSKKDDSKKDDARRGD
ncbi:MAG TPA: DUF748 domain-containing protein [Kofleriaceae bacterium]|nr:DUF748 domain-containing protein [Kofleriaceae bacterium]